MTLLPPCPLNAMTGLDCPLCGATRAVHALLELDVQRAVDLNVMLVAAVPVIAWLLVARMAALTGRRLPVPQVPVPALVVVALAFAVLRNLPFPVFAWMGT